MSTKLHASHSSWLRAFLVLVLTGIPHRALGADYTVTDCTDGASSTTLRGLVNFLISEASENKSIDASGCSTITLTQGEIRIPISLTISGGGSGDGDGTTIDANLASRVFSSFDGNMNGFNKTLTLVGINVVHGRHSTANSLPAHGGCIDVLNAVVLQDSTVSDCAATTTAGQAFGGAINAGYVTLSGSRVEGGVASADTEEADGGGIRATLGFTCTQSSISGNQATSGGANYGYGGGLYSGFNAVLTQCTIDANSAAIGGGIYFGNDLSLIDSTVSGNTATTAGTGGIEGAALTIANSTITNNFGYCGGVNTGTITMNSALIAKNHSAFGDCDDVSVGNPPILGANNLVGVFTEGTGVPEDTIGGDPILTPLADHGGPTRTHALSANSPAIEHGNNTLLLATDQRGAGFARVAGSVADIGAYERAGNDPQLLFAGFE